MAIEARSGNSTSDDSGVLSICMICRNEEQHLPRCLASVTGAADQIIVEDTGSTDRTIEIARSFGAEVYEEPWREDFSFHRNNVLARARCKWCWCLDADEEMVDTDVAQLRYHLQHDDLPPVLLIRELLKYPDGKQITIFSPRLLRRDAGIRFVHPIHEQLDIAECRATVSSIRLVHHGYVDQEGLVVKERRNLAIAQAMPDSPHAFHCRARAALTLKDWAAVEGAADGLLGCEAGPTLREEGCALGALAAFNLDHLDRFRQFVEMGSETAADSPDFAYLKVLDSLRTYLELLMHGDSASPGDFIRPWVLWHDRRQAVALMEVLLGTRRINTPGT